MKCTASVWICSFALMATFSSLSNSQVEFEDLEIGPISEGPAFSPDSSRIAFSSNAGNEGSFDIWLMNANGTNVQVLTDFPGTAEKHPDWVDNDTIVFSSDRGDGLFDIWSVSTNGDALIQLTQSAGHNTHPRVSPDGSKIVFLSNRTGKRELWTMDVDGSNQESVALMSLRVADPTWAPDSQRIAFVGCRSMSCNLFQINKNGSDTYQITSGDFQDWTPDWGVNGILFASDRDPGQKIWIVQPDGTGLQVFDQALTGALDPRWANSEGILLSRSDPEDENLAGQIWRRNASGQIEALTTIDSFVKDQDGDGIADDIDNCPLAPNTDQLDFDGDGDGDVCDPDADGDAVANELDACATTPMGDVVEPGRGCSIGQLCPSAGPFSETDPWENHGQYVSCIAKAAESFLGQGLISESEKDDIVSAAAKSAIGRR